MQASGIVTAAGKSTRMGGFPKPLLWYGSEYFAERILGVLEKAGIDDRLVVLGHEADIVQERLSQNGATIHVNPSYESGMLSSVQVGVERAIANDREGMFLWPVDFPCVPAEVLTSMWTTYERKQPDVVVPTCGGERGHPALFAASTFDPLLNAPETEGARAVVYAAETDVEEVDVQDPRVLVDIDTPEEYWDAVKRYPPDEA